MAVFEWKFLGKRGVKVFLLRKVGAFLMRGKIKKPEVFLYATKVAEMTQVSTSLTKSHTFMQEFLSSMEKLLENIASKGWSLEYIATVYGEAFIHFFWKNHGVEYIIELKECETFFEKKLFKIFWKNGVQERV